MLKEINVESLGVFSKSTSKIWALIYKIQTLSPKVFSKSERFCKIHTRLLAIESFFRKDQGAQLLTLAGIWRFACGLYETFPHSFCTEQF